MDFEGFKKEQLTLDSEFYSFNINNHDYFFPNINVHALNNVFWPWILDIRLVMKLARQYLRLLEEYAYNVVIINGKTQKLL